LPLGFRYGLSAYRNEFILFVKSTAVVGAITVFDLLAVANDSVFSYYDPFTPFVVAGFIYWIIVQFIQFGFNRLEKSLSRHILDISRT
jgi:ABC-type arginine/histidine transport system permease subunit